jgi:hypothetical protein
MYHFRMHGDTKQPETLSRLVQLQLDTIVERCVRLPEPMLPAASFGFLFLGFLAFVRVLDFKIKQYCWGAAINERLANLFS